MVSIAAINKVVELRSISICMATRRRNILDSCKCCYQLLCKKLKLRHISKGSWLVYL